MVFVLCLKCTTINLTRVRPTTSMPYRWMKYIRYGLRYSKSLLFTGRPKLVSSDTMPPPAW